MQIQPILNVLLKYEAEKDLFNKKNVAQILEKLAIDNDCLTFILFSCLTTEKNKEQLIIDFFKTSFFDGGNKEISSATKTVIRLINEVEALGVKTIVVPILVDTEPRRTWGWQTDQNELTFACEIMIDQAIKSKLLPNNWQPSLWSNLETKFKSLADDGNALSFEQMLTWSKGNGKHTITIKQQEKHLAQFASRYHFPLHPREMATRQVAAYAYEGIVLKALFPNGLITQSEKPYKEKDILFNQYQNQRSGINNPLLTIHPFR